MFKSNLQYLKLFLIVGDMFLEGEENGNINLLSFGADYFYNPHGFVY